MVFPANIRASKTCLADVTALSRPQALKFRPIRIVDTVAAIADLKPDLVIPS